CAAQIHSGGWSGRFDVW
nr:immunoglobulin heavy chain junction region [Macaca mulatta]MOX60017.1 immunoglobulin heavy chain junction region [Macaca mulatta]MOX61161.1 immunoglobulin heavy chain junction region [Macaca mulatta]MOX62157.1 immunoglobulin heavy chain junction region [Macaca mulatta]MOX64397.1 immunoglobulin heavy chain junction region [Macaca mulatta]